MRLSKLAILRAGIFCLSAVLPLCAQTQLVTSGPFPAEMEFKELEAIQRDRALRAPDELSALEHGQILMEAGLQRYAERIYRIPGPASLAIEVMTLADSRGAYSLLSLFTTTRLSQGPPGDYFAGGPDVLLMSAGNCLVRIRGTTAGDLPRRVALSVANRIGRRELKPPTVVGHVPTEQCDPASIRFFMGPKALQSFGLPVAGNPLLIPSDAQAAQARCAAQEQKGVLTLIGFPTIQLAEEYFDAGAVLNRDPTRNPPLYTRQTGTLVGILEGNFGPEAADKTLGSIQFSYSIKWIFDKSSGQGRTIWGVPVRILGTVVRSLVFTALLCLISIAAGILIAGGRMFVRKRWGRSDDSDLIRLKIDEN